MIVKYKRETIFCIQLELASDEQFRNVNDDKLSWLEDFGVMKHKVLYKKNGHYEFVDPLFEDWLQRHRDYIPIGGRV